MLGEREGPEHEAVAPEAAPPSPRAAHGPPGPALLAAGNRAVSRLLTGVSGPDDPAERAAARFAASGAPLAPLLGGVRVHTGADLSDLGADAVTRGGDIYFAAGAYRPDTPDGHRLLAHELAHTRQDPSVAYRSGEAVTVGYKIEAREPEVFLFPGSASRESLANTLYGSPDRTGDVAFVPTPDGASVDGIIAQGARARTPASLLPAALESLRWALDTALKTDVERTIALLSERSVSGGPLAELTLRWSQRSDVTTTSGGSYFDAYLRALKNRTLSQPHWYTLGQTETEKTALQWLLDEAGGAKEQIQKAIELRSAEFKGTVGYTVTDQRPEFRTGDLIGRFYGSDGGTTPVRVLQAIADDATEEGCARLVQHQITGKSSSSGLGSGVVVPSPAGGFTGYLVDFALLDATMPHPFDDPAGHYFWYYPGTRPIFEHDMWDAASRRQFQGNVRGQNKDWQDDLIAMEGAATRIRANATAALLPKDFLAAWQAADRAMIEVSGRLGARGQVDASAAVPPVRTFLGRARAQVQGLDKQETVHIPDDLPSQSLDYSYVTNPYLTADKHDEILKRLTAAATTTEWRAALTDYHGVVGAMDEYVASRLRLFGGQAGAEQARQLQYAGAAARELDSLVLDHPAGKKVRATFFPLDNLTAADAGLAPAEAVAIDLLFYVYRDTDGTWHLSDLTTPQKAKVTEAGGGDAGNPPPALFEKLNTALRFPKGRLYWELPDGSIRLMTTTAPEPWSAWVKRIGLTLGLIAMAVASGGTSIPGTLLIVASSAANIVGTGMELSEKADAGVLTSVDVTVGVLDIITGLAQAGSAVSGHIVATAAKTGVTSALAQRLDGYVYRQLVGVGLFGQAASFAVTTKDILDQYDKAKAEADSSGSDLALRRLVTHLVMSGTMLVMSGKSDLATIARGRVLRLGDFSGANVAAPDANTKATLDATHDAWVAEMKQAGMRAQAGPRTGPPLEPGLVGVYDSPQKAYQAYEATLQRPGAAEVGVFRNPQGEYVVMVGRATAVDPPEGGGPWQAVVHFHGTPGNALAMRNPAAKDVEGALSAARKSGQPVTEFVEAALPGGGRTITSYTAHPDGRIEIEYTRPSGERKTRSFGDIQQYEAEAGSRKVAIAADSPEYRELMEDADKLYRGTGGGTTGGRTALGATWHTELDAVAGPATRTELETQFGRTGADLPGLVAEMKPARVAELARHLGADKLAELAARVNAKALTHLTAGMDAAAVGSLAAHSPAHLAWAATHPLPAHARELLSLPPATLAVLAHPDAGLSAGLVWELSHGVRQAPPGRLNDLARLVPPLGVRRLHENLGDEGFLQVVRTEDRPDNLLQMAMGLQGQAAAELATTAAMPSGATVLDANMLIPLQHLRSGRRAWSPGPPATNLSNTDRARINALAGRFGVTFTGPQGAPTAAELEDLMRKTGNFVSGVTIAETPPVPGMSRGTGMRVDRADPQYVAALREMEQVGTNKFTPGRDRTFATDPPHPIGEAVGGADRVAIGDLLFAERAPNATPPVYYTGDEGVVKALLTRYGVPGTFKDVPINQPKGDPVAAYGTRFRRDNPNGFQIEIQGKRAVVIWLPNK
ncbi:DUF4157 domain-containing protein [Actinoplanes sp. CA-030573]|uniref:eCIS core domain-containing protein n=1 Tax=Actinoplanes sp. CA-030573 TaxID=3239898 RepID=UPI003D8C0277